MDYQTISRHYINSYEVLDRVVLSRYSDIPPALGEIDCSILLPSSEDNEELQKYFQSLYPGNDMYIIMVHVAIILFKFDRVISKNVERFKVDSGEVLWHIPHEFSEEMKKSLVVRFS